VTAFVACFSIASAWLYAVSGPSTAPGGKTYAELAPDDPNRTTVMTASFLRASLFASVVSSGGRRWQPAWGSCCS
jgi:hypothetical protein